MILNIHQASAWFEVLQTSSQSQTAVMKLAPGEASGKKPEAHEKSEQVLLLLHGELSSEIGGEKASMKQGDTAIIPAGVKHRFTNPGPREAVTFNVYSPPEYPPGEKG